jgi:hypothetical protein
MLTRHLEVVTGRSDFLQRIRVPNLSGESYRPLTAIDGSKTDHVRQRSSKICD